MFGVDDMGDQVLVRQDALSATHGQSAETQEKRTVLFTVARNFPVYCAPNLVGGLDILETVLPSLGQVIRKSN